MKDGLSSFARMAGPLDKCTICEAQLSPYLPQIARQCRNCGKLYPTHTKWDAAYAEAAQRRETLSKMGARFDIPITPGEINAALPEWSEMPFPEGTIHVGETFYDKLDNGLYERCVFGPQGLTGEERRGGTGEFYKKLDILGDGATEEQLAAWEKQADLAEMIMDADEGKFIFLVRS